MKKPSTLNLRLITLLLLRPMNFLRHIGLVLVIAFLGLISCNDEYIQAEGIESFVSLKFINQDSLNNVRSLIAAINDSITTIDSRITAIDTAENRLDLQDEKDSLNDVKSGLEDRKTKWSSVRSTISGGKVKIDSIVGVGTGKYIIFDDSLSSYTVPINSNADNSFFRIYLSTRNDELILSHTIESVFIENQLRAVASNLGVIDATYDSILITCADTTCYTNEAELTIYF